MPYFGGISSAERQTELDNVKKYFSLCYESVKEFSQEIIVSVASEEDYNTVLSLGYDITVVHFKDIDPIFNPANLNKYIQRYRKNYDFVFFTEADQVVYMNDKDLLIDTINGNKNIYITPQRFEQIPKEHIEIRKKRYNVYDDNRFVDWSGKLKQDGTSYVVANEPIGNESSWDDNFYRNFTEGPAYGASFICHKELFEKVNFTFSRFQPTEHSAGHNLLHHSDSICLKTHDFYSFFVDHLSGWDFNIKNLLNF